MSQNNEVIIVTPTFNRVHTLPRLYKSLLSQSNQNFSWLIIDDGSSDSSKEYVESLIEKNLLKIDYTFLENGGKARALNMAFLLADSNKMLAVVDSDDYLLNDAVETFIRYSNKYIDNNEVGAIFFHYKTSDGEILKPTGQVISSDKIMTRYDYNNQHSQNDGCVCYFPKVTKKYKYPEYENEKYVGPTVIQFEMANEYKIVFSLDVIGVAQYQVDGLTNLGRKLRLKNPLGMLYYSGLLQSKKAKFKTRLKYAVSAQAYRFISGLSKADLEKLSLATYLKTWAAVPGFILKEYWFFKHKV